MNMSARGAAESNFNMIITYIFQFPSSFSLFNTDRIIIFLKYQMQHCKYYWIGANLSNFLPTEKAQTFDPTFHPIKIGTDVGQIIWSVDQYNLILLL